MSLSGNERPAKHSGGHRRPLTEREKKRAAVERRERMLALAPPAEPVADGVKRRRRAC